MMRTQPALTIGAAVSLFIAAAISLLVASGVDITPGLATSIDRFVGACLTLAPFIAAYFIRGKVVSPFTAEKMVAQALALKPGTPVPASITSKIPGGVAPPPDPPEGVA